MGLFLFWLERKKQKRKKQKQDKNKKIKNLSFNRVKSKIQVKEKKLIFKENINEFNTCFAF